MVVSFLSPSTPLIQAASSFPCLIVKGGSIRMASFSPEMRVDAMCDHVWGIPNGRGFGVTIGMRSVTCRSARRVEVILDGFEV